MYDQGFVNWDSYISNYLTFLKDFRLVLSKLFSQNKSNALNTFNVITKRNNNIISLDNDLLQGKYFTERDTLFSYCITRNDRNQYICFK